MLWQRRGEGSAREVVRPGADSAAEGVPRLRHERRRYADRGRRGRGLVPRLAEHERAADADGAAAALVDRGAPGVDRRRARVVKGARPEWPCSYVLRVVREQVR